MDRDGDAGNKLDFVQTETRRAIETIIKYAAKAKSHSELSTVYMLAVAALEAYDAEQKEKK